MFWVFTVIEVKPCACVVPINQPGCFCQQEMSVNLCIIWLLSFVCVVIHVKLNSWRYIGRLPQLLLIQDVWCIHILGGFMVERSPFRTINDGPISSMLLIMVVLNMTDRGSAYCPEVRTLYEHSQYSLQTLQWKLLKFVKIFRLY